MSSDNIITLFFLVVAGLIFLNLRSVLDRRTGNEKQPPEWRGNPRDTGQPADDGKVVTLPRRDSAEPVEPENRYASIDAVVPEANPVNAQLRQVLDADPSFEPRGFLDGARMAYEMIVMAFAEGDRKTLKSLLSADVYEGFLSAIVEREKRGEAVKSTFVGIDKLDFIRATVAGNDVAVTIRVVSQLITATHDKAGALVDGDPDQVSEVIDIWTFSRDTRSRDPNWKLVSTQSES